MSVKFVSTEEFKNMITNDEEKIYLYKNQQYSNDSRFKLWLEEKGLCKFRWFEYRGDFYVEKRGDYLDKPPYDVIKDYKD